MFLKSTLVTSAIVGATSVSSFAATYTYYVGRDSLATLPSGTYASLPNPNANRLTVLLGHGDHYHNKSNLTYTGGAANPQIAQTTSNFLPEGTTRINLVAGSGAFAGLLRNDTTQNFGDYSYGTIQFFTPDHLTTEPQYTDTLSDEYRLFNSSGGRYANSMADVGISVRLMNVSAGMAIYDTAGNLLADAKGETFFLGGGASMASEIVVATTNLTHGLEHNLSFQVFDTSLGGSDPVNYGDSGIVQLRFVAVPEPASLGLLGFGSLFLRRRR